MEQSDIFRSIGAASEGLYKEAGSRFIALAFPVTDEVSIRLELDRLRRAYHDARHICYAWRLAAIADGPEGPALDLGSCWRANDDGEPSGTAGRQILGQIDSAGLCDVLVAVVRYFGGIKLGVPGLIHAYRTATADAICQAQIVEKTASRRWRIGFEYAQMPAVMDALKALGVEILTRDFTDSCTLELRVRLRSEQDFLERIEKIGIFKNKIEKL